uniref:Uncharacterized protein n=1 Tax=Cannabis sativa TaxID=3483 RepID=A0A803PTK3_CANSA
MNPMATPATWNLFAHSLSISLIVKLYCTNFLAWKSKVILIVIGHDLDNIPFTGMSLLQVFVTVEPNPQYLQWNKCDQLLLSWLRSSMYEEVLATGQFSHVRKGALSISDYVDKVQSLSDAIIIAGSTMGEQDVILKLFNRLHPEYNSVVLGITFRSDALSLDEVQTLLMANKINLEQHNAIIDLTIKMQANLTYGAPRTRKSLPYQPTTRGSTLENQNCLYGR